MSKQEELRAQIVKYRTFTNGQFDSLTTERIKAYVENLKQQLEALKAKRPEE